MTAEIFAAVDPGWLLLLGAGVLAGLINGVVGSGTLISFPVLLLLGYPPLVANISNNIGLLPGSAAAVYQYRAVLARERSLLVWTVPLAAGGSLTGAVLLTALPGEVFATVVPVLIVAALALVAVQPVVQPRIAVRGAGRGWAARGDAPPGQGAPPVRAGLGGRAGPVRPWVMAVVGLLGVYGGYFGAAQGIPLLVIFALGFGLPFSRANGFKNTMAGVSSLVATVVFVTVGGHHVDWAVVGLLAVGSTVGGALGARVGMRLPQPVYRAAIIVVGLLALWATVAW